MGTVRTRFAPSPTGYLHIGGARTALFSWLYARRHAGTFILRIEDTDRERSTDEAVAAILDGMEWLGLQHDEGPYFQTQRFDRYADVIQQLLSAGKAYYCTCSKERLENLRSEQMEKKLKPRYDGHCRARGLKPSDSDAGAVVRFVNPEGGSVLVNDAIHGQVTFTNDELDDLIIARTDGTPTYNFTVVVDDYDMRITHVIRGDDHLNNTPRQINILRALSAEIPIYAHVPMILGSDGKRLSKRHGAVSVLEYRDQGYLPEALLNYLVRLGWSHGDEEIFSLQDLTQKFDLPAVNKAAASLNPDKLTWLNQHYIKTMASDTIARKLEPYLSASGITALPEPSLSSVVKALRERSKTLVDLAASTATFYLEFDHYTESAVQKHFSKEAGDILQILYDRLNTLPDWSAAAVHGQLAQLAEAKSVKLGLVAQPLRVALTGTAVSPPIDTMAALLGKDRTLARVRRAIEFIAALS